MTKRALANLEREQLSQRRGRFGRSVLLLLATILSFGSVSLLLTDQLYRPDRFVIDQLKIKGSFRHLNPVDIETRVASEAVGNFFSVDLAAIKLRVETLQWVQTATVRREWPNTLAIHVQEQRPVMRWGQDGWLNDLGQVIKLPPGMGPKNSIRLQGRERDAATMLQAARRWQQQLSASDLVIEKLSLSANQAWQMALREHATGHRFALLLGHHEVDQRLNRFQYLYNNQLQQPGYQLQRVDARYPDGLAVRGELQTTNDGLASAANPENELAMNDLSGTLSGNTP
ncbi:MAG: FtsQ-type POTRA domain-containing protein [Gammaproteobacteria bacterium]|nr:FtsQ-type POTRA domain-containing protein [Gammaproteobacteria bacterium]